MDTAICKELVLVNMARRGDGKETPVRIITQVFEKDGTLIAEKDPDSYTLEQVVAICKRLNKGLETSEIIRVAHEFELHF